MWKYFIFPRKIDTHLYPLHNTEEKVMSIWQKKLAQKNWKNLPFLISAFAKQYWYSNSSHFSLVLHRRGNLIYDLNVTKCHRNVNSNSTFLLTKVYTISYITKVIKWKENSYQILRINNWESPFVNTVLHCISSFFRLFHHLEIQHLM